MKALSIRQPWAWLIVSGHKPIENRSWRTHFRGRFLIHASAGMTRDEYLCAWNHAEDNGIALPAFGNLERGGIIGMAEIVDCVEDHPSPWFFGPFGWVICNPEPLDFRACKGTLGFFTPPPNQP